MKFILFYLTYTAVFAFQTLIIKKRLINKLDFSNKTRMFLSLILYITFFGALMYPLARNYPLVPNWLYFLLSLPMGVIFLTFTITLSHDIISFGLKKTSLKKIVENFSKKV